MPPSWLIGPLSPLIGELLERVGQLMAMPREPPSTYKKSGLGEGDLWPAYSLPTTKPTRKPSINFFFFNILKMHSIEGTRVNRQKQKMNSKVRVRLVLALRMAMAAWFGGDDWRAVDGKTARDKVQRQALLGVCPI